MSEITKFPAQLFSEELTRNGSSKILVISDNSDSLESNSVILDQAGYAVVTAENGLAGLEIAQKEVPDLIISDVIFSDFDAVEFCRRLRAVSRLKEIPIIFVSDLSKNAISAVKALEAGADHYIEAPFEPVRLIAEVSRLLEQKRAEYAVARHITRATEDERILNESKKQIADILDSITDGFFVLDGNWNFTYLNPATEHLWQQSRENLLGKNFWEEFPGVLDTAFDSKYREVMEKRIPVSFTELYPDQNVWLDVQASPVKDGISIYFRDVTKLKIAEQEKDRLASQIEQQHLRLNNIIANVPGIVWETWVKPDEAMGQINFISDYVEKMLGYTVNEWLTTPGFWLSVIYPEDREEALRQVAGNFKGNRTIAFEVRLVAKDGRVIWTELQTQTITNSENKVIGVRGVTTDITARKEAETAIAEANSRAISEYERLVQGLAALAQALGSARDLNGVFRGIQEFARVSVPCDAILISLCEQEQKMRKIVYIWYNHEELDTSVFEAVPVGGGAAGTAIKTGEVVIIPDYFQHIMRKGVKLSFGYDEDSRDPRSSLIVPMKIKGITVGVIEIQSYQLAAFMKEHAVTMQMAANLAANAVENVRLLEQERHQEEQLRQSQKLESVGRLAGGIAHDFNNMLTAINGYSDLTLRKLNADDPLRRNLEEIKKAGERSAVLTHQLLAFSRRQVLKPTVLNLNEVIIDISKMLNRLIGEDIQLNIVPESNLGFVEADSGQLTQVIMNLVVNARDAMPGGGTIIIETSNVYLDTEYVKSHIPTQIGSYILLAVSDTGVGMSDEVKEQIFEPFFTTKKPGAGTGLGLSTTYGIVKQSGGYIWVESEIDKGTTFKIYFPHFDEEYIRPKENKVPQIIQTGTEMILLVEDEELVRNMSRQILEACGYHVIEAQNGIEALSVCAAQNEKIDLLLTDVVMPQMGGRELAEKLTDLHPEIRVLFASGYTDDAVIRQGIVRENMNFIQKPFTFDALALKVREILDGKS